MAEQLYSVTGIELNDEGAYSVDEKMHLSKDEAEEHYKYCKDNYYNVLIAME